MKGPELLADLGGLHSFMHWDGGLLTVRLSLIPTLKMFLLEIGFRWFSNGLAGEALGSDGRRGEVSIASRSE